MSLDRGDFAAFFAALHDGHGPFAWQERLLDAVLADGWPDTIDAPTGAGKTAVIDVHVFALALAATAGGPLPPRRLAMIVGRRVLVDDQYRHALSLARQLTEATEPGVLQAVAAGLRLLRDDIPLRVARLRGGLPPSRRWADDPLGATVLCATPDMFGSRLLFRGYGSSSRAWPREAGLLSVDTVAVVDEAHLAQQMLVTARRVAELVPVAEHDAGFRPLQVVETTATPTATGARRVGVEDGDLEPGSTLSERLRRPKPVTLVARRDWAAVRPRHTVVDELVVQVVAQREKAAGTTVGCFVNTVARAVAAAAALRGAGLRTVLLCGQVRPIDVERLEDRYPGLLSPAGNPEIDVIVSTQTLEVGVDLDLAAIVTELASGSALVQRAGRVNRRGLRPAGPVVVIVPDGPLRADARSGPYEEPELAAALEWLHDRADDPDGLAPWALRTAPPVRAARRRDLLQRPELGQAWHWARTSDDLAAEPELDLWLSDDFEPDTSVGIVVRRDLPDDAAEAIELIKLLPPRRHEVFGVPIRTAREALAATDEVIRRAAAAGLPAMRVRGDEVTALDWTVDGEERRPRIRPGDVVVVDATIPLFTAPAPGEDNSEPQVVVPVGDESRRHPSDDVLEAPATLRRGLRRGEIVLRIDLPVTGLSDDLTAGIDEPRLSSAQELAAVRAHLALCTDDPMAVAARALLDAAGPPQADVIVTRVEGVPRRVLVVDARRAVADDEVRQEWSPSPKVPLVAHQEAVAKRAGELGDALNLAPDLVEALRLAGLHHDDGKGDPRFQLRLGARPGELLAKSGDRGGPIASRRRRDPSGLLPGWRHEQLSVVHTWAALPDGAHRDLVLRLIGTTHGHGRGEFPHAANDLVGPHTEPSIKAAAVALFDEGEWFELIERTDRRYGVWGCAYLEAVLRAADGQVSREGG